MNRRRFQSIVLFVVSSLFIFSLLVALIAWLLVPVAANAAPVAGADAIAITAVENSGKADPSNPYDLAQWQATFSTGESCRRDMNIHQDMPATGEVQSFSKPWWGFGNIIQFTDKNGDSWTCNP